MLVEPQQLQAITVCQIGIAANDQIVFVIAVAGCGAEVVATADDRRRITGEVSDDGFGVHQDIALLTLPAFLEPAFQPFV